MNDVRNYERVEHEWDPERCDGVVSAGPCPNKAVPGSRFCMRHGGAHKVRQNRQEAIRMYQFTKYKERIGDLSTHGEIKSLHMEIGVIRMSIEELINNCNSHNDFMVRVPQINQLTQTVKSLIEAWQKLQERNNLLLDKKQIMMIADGVVKVVTQYVTDPALVSKIGMEVCNVIEKSILSEDSAGSAT